MEEIEIKIGKQTYASLSDKLTSYATLLEQFLELRFRDGFVTSDELFAHKSQDAFCITMPKLENDEGIGIHLINLKTGEKGLQFNLKKTGALKINGEFSLLKNSDDIRVNLASRFLRKLVTAEKEPIDILALGKGLLRDGDILYTTRSPIQGWVPHSLGILTLRNDGVYIDDKKIISGKLDEDFYRIDVIPDGLLFDVNGDTPKTRTIKKLDLDLQESVILSGPEEEINQKWKPHPHGVVICRGRDIFINGENLLGTVPDDCLDYHIDSAGKLVLLRELPDQIHPLPGGEGTFAPGAYISIESAVSRRLIYELKHKIFSQHSTEWTPHGILKNTGYGSFVLDSPEWDFYDRYADWERFKVNETTLDDHWVFYEIGIQGSSELSLERKDGFKPAGVKVLWDPAKTGTNALFADWEPALHFGEVTGVILKEGNNFVYRSSRF